MKNIPDWSADFKPTFEAHRNRRLKQLLLLLLIEVYAFCVPHLPGHGGPIIAVYIFVGFIGFVFYLAYPDIPLICPGCKMDPDSSDGRFCPLCGSESVEAQERVLLFYRSPKCGACGKVMSVGVRFGSLYKIRFCRQCGAFLYDRGIRP